MEEDTVIAIARRQAALAVGAASADDVQRVLAMMVIQAVRGASPGFLRLAPAAGPAKLKLDDKEPVG